MSRFFDIFGLGTGRKFYLRDFKNAARLRPAFNPPRQKFQGYVNFIFNREIFQELFADNLFEADKELRTTLSSFVRSAELPSVNFDTEIKNRFNQKKVVYTGVQYNPVNLVVFDTVGNEWLAVLMKYYAYHFMNPRNLEDDDNGLFREIYGSRSRQGGYDTVNSKFGLDGQESRGGAFSRFNSNKAGFNPNRTANFFERIDYVLYHGNKGVQYSIINPIITSFKPGNIDYADSQPLEFQFTLEYEAFTVYSGLNFNLTEEDADRFEDARNLTGPAFTARPGFGNEQAELTLKERQASFLGKTNDPKQRTPQVGLAPNEFDLSDPSGPPIDQSIFDADPRVIASDRGDLRSTYGAAADFSTAPGFGNTGNPFIDAIIDVADNTLAAAIHGGNIRDAAINAAVGSVVNIIETQNQQPPVGGV